MLEVVSGNASGETIAVQDQLVIGRHVQGVGQLANDVELSRQHARISRGPAGQYVIEDSGSTNGTFVNRQRVQAARPLALGDTIDVGATSLLVKSLPAPPQARQATVPRQVVAEPAAPAAGRLDIQVSIDFEAQEARLVLEPGGSFRLVPGAGGWQLEGEQ